MNGEGTRKIMENSTKYIPYVTLDVTASTGVGPYYGGSIKIEWGRISIELNPDPVISKTIAAFQKAIQEEIDGLIWRDLKADPDFKDAVYAGFCEYMERMFSGRFNR